MRADLPHNRHLEKQVNRTVAIPEVAFHSDFAVDSNKSALQWNIGPNWISRSRCQLRKPTLLTVFRDLHKKR